MTEDWTSCVPQISKFVSAYEVRSHDESYTEVGTGKARIGCVQQQMVWYLEKPDRR